MKRIIVLGFFAIGLMLSLPGMSSGSGSPPDQVCFAQGLPTFDLPVMVASQELAANTEFNFLSYSTFAPATVPEEGGCFVIQDSNLELQATYLNNKNATFNTTAITMLYNDDIRTCLKSEVVQSQILITQNIESGSRCTIRADSKG
jgi:hypothetical protein